MFEGMLRQLQHMQQLWQEEQAGSGQLRRQVQQLDRELAAVRQELHTTRAKYDLTTGNHVRPRTCCNAARGSCAAKLAGITTPICMSERAW